MARCSLCEKEVYLSSLQTLLTAYQVNDVKDICQECTTWANKTKCDLIDEIGPQMRAAILAKKGAKPETMFFKVKRAIVSLFQA